MSLVKFIKAHDELTNSDEIILFAGSFNPWHKGHSSCLKLLDTSAPIIIIPDHNPYKELRENNIDDLDHIKEHTVNLSKTLYIFDEFYKRNEKNPSYKWLAEIKSQLPKKKISLLIGFDTFMSIDRWINSDIVLRSLDCLYIASREDDQKAKSKQSQNLKEISNSLNIVFLGNHKYEHISSTQIRNKKEK